MRFGRQFFDTASLNLLQRQPETPAPQLGIPGFTGDVRLQQPRPSGVQYLRLTGVSNASTNWYQDDTTWQGAEQISWNHGTHNIMAGVEFRNLIPGARRSTAPAASSTSPVQFTGYAASGLPARLPSLSDYGRSGDPRLGGRVARRILRPR